MNIGSEGSERKSRIKMEKETERGGGGGDKHCEWRKREHEVVKESRKEEEEGNIVVGKTGKILRKEAIRE